MRTEVLMEKQRTFFESGKTQNMAYRMRALERLEQALKAYEQELCRALQEDLGKSRGESYMCEIGLTLSELRYMKQHLRSDRKSVV